MSFKQYISDNEYTENVEDFNIKKIKKQKGKRCKSHKRINCKVCLNDLKESKWS